MNVDSLSPRLFAAIGLLALLPVVWYGLGRSLTAAVFAAVNVALVIGLMYVAMSPVEGGGHDGEASA